MSNPQDRLKAIGADVREIAAGTKHAAEEQLARARRQGEEMLEDARDELERYEESIVLHLRRHPVRSVLFAAGLGLFLGLVFRRS